MLMLMENYIVDLSSAYVWAFAAGMFLMKCWGAWLSWKRKSYILDVESSARDIVSRMHPLGASLFTKEKLDKSLQYSRSHEAFGQLEHKVCSMLYNGMFLVGVMPAMMHLFNFTCGMSFWLSLLASTVIMQLVDVIVDCPFSWHNSFKIESKFGFNNMTMKTFMTDKLKSFIIGVLMFAAMSFIAVKLLELHHSMFGKVGLPFCIIVACISPFFSLVYELISFKFIDPLFNKLSKLDNQALESRISKMMQDAGYSRCNIFVEDTSRRSKHSNAYFAGWGKSKRLVLSDTLLSTMSNDEVLAIVGHELGHAKRHHLVIGRALGMFGNFIFLLAASHMMYNVDMMHAFGYRFITTDEMMMAYVLCGIMTFMQLWGAVSWTFGGLSSFISQKMEYAADMMSAKFLKSGEPLISALFKLYIGNMSYPLVDKTVEMWSCSHPSLLNRVKALAKHDIEEAKPESMEAK